MELKKQEQVQTGLPLLKSGDEKYEIAVSGKKIINSSLDELKQVLRLAMLKLGMRGNNLPDEEEKQVLLLHIVENYGTHTCAEITLAFDLAISGKLNVDAKAYENFSCLYVSSIINAYREWSKDLAVKYIEKKSKLALPYEHRDSLSDEEMEQWISEWDIEKLNNLKSVSYIPVLFYDWMVRNDKILVTPEGKKQYFQKAALQKKQDHETLYTGNKLMVNTVDQFILEFNSNYFSEGNTNQIKNLAKKMIVFDYLKRKANELSKVQ